MSQHKYVTKFYNWLELNETVADDSIVYFNLEIPAYDNHQEVVKQIVVDLFKSQEHLLKPNGIDISVTTFPKWTIDVIATRKDQEKYEIGLAINYGRPTNDNYPKKLISFFSRLQYSYHSQRKYQVLKSQDDKNFKIRVLDNNLKKLDENSFRQELISSFINSGESINNRPYKEVLSSNPEEIASAIFHTLLDNDLSDLLVFNKASKSDIEKLLLEYIYAKLNEKALLDSKISKEIISIDQLKNSIQTTVSDLLKVNWKESSAAEKESFKAKIEQFFSKLLAMIDRGGPEREVADSALFTVIQELEPFLDGLWVKVE